MFMLSAREKVINAFVSVNFSARQKYLRSVAETSAIAQHGMCQNFGNFRASGGAVLSKFFEFNLSQVREETSEEELCAGC